MSPSKKVSPPGKASKVGKPKGAKVITGTKRKKKEERPPGAPIEAPPASKPENKPLTIILRILAVLTVVGITVYVYSIRDHVEEFAELGFFGAFLIMLIANATVILPAPGLAVIFAMGAVLNPLGVGLSAGLGGALGEVTGYLAGYSGQAAVENTQTYKRLLPWVQKYGAWVILVLSAFPNPFFDAAGIAAGIAKIPVWQFLLACWVGVTIKTLIFAFAGAYSIDWVASFYE
ncbi:MAG: VTT domain-containing protein [Anaerolineales bacterium]|nr:VTT domain-containing protein [Chloroflexota bacterium]MBK6646892.1 VTT domain-containing protein [Anaerolineales bacterium]MCC6986574.1 VTT domain-containing protein [Anaerolineales bacterium]